MINETMYGLGNAPSAIRELFAYGLERKAQIGEDKVFDFSIGNPSVPAPDKVANRVELLFSRSQNGSVGQIASRHICLYRELVHQRSTENKKGLLKASLYHVKWCPRRDLNPHVFRQRFLRPPRLPFRHSGAGLHYT